jgi:probable rRNA maturation factor
MSDALQLSVHVDEGLAVPLDSARVEAALERVLREEGVEAAELSVAFVDDDRIAALNREYLMHEGPTDVISFPLHASGQPVLGDVYVGVQQAERQARELGERFEVELLRLAVHGTLHVLGYDHPEGDEREQSPMYRRQEELLFLILGSGAAG